MKFQEEPVKLRQINESLYDDLEDNDAFQDEMQWAQDNYAFIVGPYQLTAHTLYDTGTRDMDQVVLFVDGEDFENINDPQKLNDIKRVILQSSKIPDWLERAAAGVRHDAPGRLKDHVRDLVQHVCFDHYQETVEPDLGLFQ